MQIQNAVSVRLPGELRARLNSLAEMRQRSINSLLIQAVESFVMREEQREALRQEAQKAHEDYIHTGLHLGAAEVDAWLAELENGHDVEPPKCHI